MPEVDQLFDDIIPGTTTHHYNFFKQCWLSVSLDKAHNARNQARSYTSVLCSTPIALILTATPLHTSISDLYNLGAVIGIPALVKGYESFQQDLKAIQHAQKAVTEEDLSMTLAFKPLKVGTLINVV